MAQFLFLNVISALEGTQKSEMMFRDSNIIYELEHDIAQLIKNIVRLDNHGLIDINAICYNNKDAISLKEGNVTRSKRNLHNH